MRLKKSLKDLYLISDKDGIQIRHHENSRNFEVEMARKYEMVQQIRS